MNMKAEFINPFMEATISVLKTMALTEPVPGKPFIKKNLTANGDVSGIVGLTGAAEGSLCLTFTKECILFISTQIFGEEQKEINDEVKDAVGELTNQISGDSRRRLQEAGYTFHGSVPSVISGLGHEVRSMTKGPILAIPFTTQAGKFSIEVCFQ